MDIYMQMEMHAPAREHPIDTSIDVASAAHTRDPHLGRAHRNDVWLLAGLLNTASARIEQDGPEHGGDKLLGLARILTQ